MNPRGRFAPTPSGNMHIGNLATALLAWLQIRQLGGEFVLRMEDIDRPRCKPEYYEAILEDLRWPGIDWDEGPDVGGSMGPYIQSERHAYYEQALRLLQQSRHVYPCYCSRAQLAAHASAPHGLASEGPIYPGTCRGLSESEQLEKAKHKTPAMRFQIGEAAIAYEDGLLGKQQFRSGYGGDFIIKRADGIFAYQLAVVVDDAMMNITHVVRGIDLLDSTPRQIQLYKALSYSVPEFTHVPLMHMQTNEKISKRHSRGAVSTYELRKANVPPERLIGWIAYLYGQLSSPEPLTAGELLQHFRWSAVPKTPVLVPQQMITQLYA